MTVILTILTDPPGCQVLINGEAKGNTNSEGRLIFPRLPLAHYEVEVRKDGFGSMKKGFQAGTESPTLVFKLIASLDDQVNQFNQLVGAGKLTGPESPNAFDLVSGVSAKYPDRAELVSIRSTLVSKLTEIADASVNATISKWRGVTRADIERGQSVSECLAKLKSEDNRAAARVAYLTGVLAMRDWLAGPPGASSAAQGKPAPDFLAQARDSLGAAVQADGSWSAASYQLGRLLLFSGSADAAQASFIKTTQLEPNWAPGHVGLADAYYAAGKRKESVAEYQKAVKLDPANARASAGLGLARWSTGESKDGLKDIERAIQLDPSTGLPHLNLAIVYADSKKKKERDKAVEELNEAIRRNPDNLEFRNEIAARLIAGIKERDKK
jgi:tetratricopeptide (TPR) repeat protein